MTLKIWVLVSAESKQTVSFLKLILSLGTPLTLLDKVTIMSDVSILTIIYYYVLGYIVMDIV